MGPVLTPKKQQKTNPQNHEKTKQSQISSAKKEKRMRKVLQDPCRQESSSPPTPAVLTVAVLTVATVNTAAVNPASVSTATLSLATVTYKTLRGLKKGISFFGLDAWN